LIIVIVGALGKASGVGDGDAVIPVGCGGGLVGILVALLVGVAIAFWLVSFAER